jgi:hypothetical protein
MRPPIRPGEKQAEADWPAVEQWCAGLERANPTLEVACDYVMDHTLRVSFYLDAAPRMNWRSTPVRARSSGSAPTLPPELATSLAAWSDRIRALLASGTPASYATVAGIIVADDEQMNAISRDLTRLVAQHSKSISNVLEQGGDQDERQVAMELHLWARQPDAVRNSVRFLVDENAWVRNSAALILFRRIEGGESTLLLNEAVSGLFRMLASAEMTDKNKALLALGAIARKAPAMKPRIERAVWPEVCRASQSGLQGQIAEPAQALISAVNAHTRCAIPTPCTQLKSGGSNEQGANSHDDGRR